MGLADLERDLNGGGGGIAALERDVNAPQSSGIGQAYQNVRGAAGKLIDFLNDPTGSFAGVRRVTGMPPASEQYNPLPANLTSGLAQTAVGLAPGGGGVRNALMRVGAAGAGGAGGAALEGQDPMSGAKQGAVPTAVMEAVAPPLAKVAVSLPFVKSAINEGQSRQLLQGMTDVNPDVAAPIKAAPVSPYLKGGTTAASIKRANEGGSLGDAVEQRFRTNLADISTRAGNPVIASPSLKQGYDMMPQLEQQMVGPVSPAGFTLDQAHTIRGWLGGKAFAMSPQGQGVSAAAKQQLWAGMTKDMAQAVARGGPDVLRDWQQSNHEYGGMQALMEALSGAFQGQPNRIMLNRSALSDYLAKNEQDITRRLGSPEAYQRFVNQALGGGQPGTRDYLTSGAGSPSDAFQQSMGRGTNTGSLNMLGVPFRTLLPNFGSQYTGAAPQTLPPYLQNILDVAAQKGAQRLQ